jgi:hypothetical protein
VIRGLQSAMLPDTLVRSTDHADVRRIPTSPHGSSWHASRRRAARALRGFDCLGEGFRVGDHRDVARPFDRVYRRVVQVGDGLAERSALRADDPTLPVTSWLPSNATVHHSLGRGDLESAA